MRNELIRDMPEHEYHADPCHTPSLSSSIAKIIHQKSEAHAHLAHPKLGGGGPKRKSRRKDSMDTGTVVHKMLLGKGPAVRRLDFGDYKTKAAREGRDDAKARGEIPVLEKDYAELEDAEQGIKARLADMGLSFGTDTEVTVLWAQDGIQCRARLDDIDTTPEIIIITDLKTTKDASPSACEKTISNLGYDISRATYIDGIQTLFPKAVVNFQWIFAELVPPYAVTPMYASEDMDMIGKAKWDSARERWGVALDADDWPCYVRRPVEANVPYWELKAFHEADSE